MPCSSSECQRIARTLHTLRKLSHSLYACVDVDRILDLLVEEAVPMAGADSGLVVLCGEEGIAHYRQFEQGRLVAGEPRTPDAGAPGSVVLTTAPFFSNDPLHDPQVDRARAADYRVRSVASVPISNLGGQLVGYLELRNKKDPGGFSEIDLDQLESVAQVAAQAIANAMAYRKISEDAAQLERRVAERTGQLQDLNEELEEFAASASHNLRAPLRAIEGFAEILLEHQGRPDDPERAGFLRRILAAARTMDQLIRDLLAYSLAGRQDLQSRTVDLDLVVRDAEQQLKVSNEAGDLRLEVAGPLPQVKGDHATLVLVLQNLFTNAAKYRAPGAVPKVRVSAQLEGGWVRLMVQDEGIGIAPQDQERIFRPFERLHGSETYPGTGLGLAIARRAVTRLGGRIGVQSRAGEGSRFWIELPQAPEPSDG